MPTNHRSFLFVPGNRPERFDTAYRSGADVVIIDLEDAVSPEDKEFARDAVARWLSRSRPIVLRINGVQTPWFQKERPLLEMGGIGAVMLPKAEQAKDILQVSGAGARLPVLPLIETAAGYRNVGEIAQTRGVQRLVFGSLDFKQDLGITGDDDELLFFRSGLVLESRFAGLPPPLDGISTEINDQDVVRADAARARRLGFGGKLCIHPRQVGTVNAAFTPSDEEVAWAKRVLAASTDSGQGVTSVDGKMVDRPVVLRAQSILRSTTSGAIVTHAADEGS
jgi:citrate lyase subunit beta/citryl-CoA lyase